MVEFRKRKRTVSDTLPVELRQISIDEDRAPGPPLLGYDPGKISNPPPRDDDDETFRCCDLLVYSSSPHNGNTVLEEPGSQQYHETAVAQLMLRSPDTRQLVWRMTNLHSMTHLSFHMTMYGILICTIYLWEVCLSVGTYTLELMFIVILLSPHILVAVLAGYTLTKHTLTRFGFHGPGCMLH